MWLHVVLIVESSLFLLLTQYMHPIETESYRETARAIRMIGKDCIERRIRAIKTGEQVPNDILSHILEHASKKLDCISCLYRMYTNVDH